MKKSMTIIALAVMLASCSNSYQFVQVHEYSAGSGNSLTVENNDVRITYSVSNLENGWCSYTVYNKTDGFVYIDKSKSFTVDPGGLAHNIIVSDEHCVMTEKKQPAFQAATSPSDSADYSVYRTADVIVIPPGAKKILFGVASGNGLMLHCDLPQYPSSSVSVNLNRVVFTAVTTYRTDNKQGDVTITNAVTLDKVSNMPEYLIARYIQRPVLCENMKEAGKIYPPDNEQVYDLIYDVSESSLTFPYYVKNSSTKYFDYKQEYGWFPSVNGYKKIR